VFGVWRSEPRKPFLNLKQKYMTFLALRTGWWRGYLTVELDVGMWRSRFGNYNVTGKTVTWDAMAIFRFEDQKIIEEWVTRDELGMVLQSGLLETTYNKYQS
jgi:SnoaL-like polyketide cyclase